MIIGSLYQPQDNARSFCTRKGEDDRQLNDVAGKHSVDNHLDEVAECCLRKIEGIGGR